LLVVGALIVGGALTAGGLYAVGLLAYNEPRDKEETTTASSATKAPAQTNESPKTTTQANKTIPPMTALQPTMSLERR
jgi:uncharacterized membrane protein YebE (DUF533 family)